VGARYFEHKARRAWWATHLEAWRRSGVTRTEYCRLHRLTKSTFDRWLGALNSLESAREEARKRRKRTREPVSTDKRNKAVQAFWAMHVEALNWSGVSAKDYAAGHHISVYSLRTWRARLEAEQPGVSAAAVCRHHNIATSMIFRWRVQFGVGRDKPANLAAVRIADEQHRGTHDAGLEAVALQEMLPIPPGAIAVELADGRRVFAPAGSNPEVVRRYVAEREEKAPC
jgi:transposase-like protein